MARVLRTTGTMGSSANGKRIVLVDDEEALAWSLGSRLLKAYPTAKIVTAHDGETALEHIFDTATDLLIADIRMPGMNGIDLVLSARARQRELPVIVMTAFKSVDMTRLDGGPFTGFLEKPFEFEALRALVEEALAPPKVGFSGAINVQTLPDIVQLYVLSSATGVLSVRHKSGEGHLYFEQGAILHAVTQRFQGDEAFYEVMMWSGGEFSMRVGATTQERTIRSHWQELLMESVRRLDEARRSEEPASLRTGWTLTPPAHEASIDDSFFEYEATTRRIPSARVPDVPLTELTTEPTMNIKDGLAKLNQIDGFIGAALVDSESGMLLGQEGGAGLNLEVAAAGNTEVVRAKRKTMNNLGLKDAIEDVLISLSKQYHLIRPLRSRPTLFFYVALDRQRANLAMARITLADVEKDLIV